MTDGEAAQILQILRDNTSVQETLWWGFISQSKWLIDNRENLRIARASVPRPPIEQITSAAPVLLQDSSCLESGFHKLPTDLLRAILWELSVPTLVVLKRVDKHFSAFMKDQQFWRRYYLQHHAAISNEVLSLTDLTYGLKLMAAKSGLERLSISLWEEIAVNSYRAHGALTPQRPWLEHVYCHYPQLIDTQNSIWELRSITQQRTSLKWKDAPYSNVWFVARANNDAVYHLGFEKLNDGQYNGILFLTPDMDRWEDRFHGIRFIFEWFAAKNECEFAEKLKPLCELFLAIRKSKYTNITRPSFYKNIAGWLRTAVNERDRVTQSIGTNIEQAAKQFLARQGTPVSATFARQVNELIARFAAEITVSDSTLEQCRQKNIPLRSQLNTKYLWRQHKMFYDFNSHQWGAGATKSYKYITKHRKEPKETPYIALMKIYRVVLNSVLMPLLKSFWPENIQHSDCDLSHHVQWTDTLNVYQELVDFKTHVPFCHISVNKAYPRLWPLIAVGLANHLLPKIIALVDDCLEGGNSGAALALGKLIANVNLMAKNYCLAKEK